MLLRRCLPLLLAVCLSITFGGGQRACAQLQSVNPGVNKQFENPNVETFVERFERDGREAYDRRADILKASRITPGMTVADIGAGTGLFARLFSAEVGPTGRVYAVDIAENFVKHIEDTAKKEGLSNVTAVLCTADDVRLPPESVDLAFICDVYHHFEFPERTMRFLHRALKPGGQVILIDFHRIPGVSSDFAMTHVRAGQEVFTQEILQAGFRQVEEVKGMLKDAYFVRFEKANEPAGSAN